MKITPTTTYTLRNGVKIPVIGLGVYLSPKKETEHIVYTGLKQGYRHVDTAKFYGNEREVSLGIAKFLEETPSCSRSDIFYTTKIYHEDFGYEETKKAIAKSLEEAKELGYIDLLLMHSPTGGKEKRLATWKAFQEFYEQGKLKAIGISNFSIAHTEELYGWDGLKVEPMVNQFEINPWLTRKELCEYCKKKGIVIEAFSPLTRGQRLDDPQLVSIAEKYPGRSTAQLLIRWSLEMGFIPLPKSSNEKRLLQNLQACDFEMSKEDVKALTHDEDYFLMNKDFDPIKNCP